MKKLLVAASLIALSAPAFAADMAPRMYSKAPPMVMASIYDWTGFYIGVNAGYAFDGRSFNTITANDPAALVGITAGDVIPNVRTRADGFTGGGQIGYNYQFHNSPTGGFVIGVEADAAYMDLRQTSNNFGALAFDTQFQSRLDFLGTVRGRIGYAFDRFLVYGTGGFAYGSVNNSMSILNPAGVVGYTGSQDNMRTGYAYGGGAEYALASDSFFNFFHASSVTVKVEYMHYDLGRNSFLSNGIVAAGAVPGSAFTNSVRTDGDLVRAGLNYKFGAPVVAKY